MKKIFTKGELIWITFTLILIMCIMVAFTSCTENTRAKTFGGKMTVTLEQNQKLVNVTWKDEELWVLVRPMRLGETPETYTFYEKSPFGIIEGKVIINEK